MSKETTEMFADISTCGRYRWSLERIWDWSLPRATWIMLNPSTADAFEDDPTIRRCINFSKRIGCGKLIVVNLFPIRATSPADCRYWMDDDMDYVKMMAVNAAVVKRRAVHSKFVIAGWGAAQWIHDGVEDRMLSLFDDDIYCFGTTKSGAPKHPLYLPASAPLTIYRQGRGDAA